MVNCHSRGNKQVKAYSVEDFVNAMIELGCMKTEKHDLAYYMALPYTKLLRPDEDGDIVARIVELPGCSAHGENEAEALKNLQEAQRLWLEDRSSGRSCT